MADGLKRVAGALRHRFRRPALLREALTHTSVAGEGRATRMERLEFLGDAVLQLAVTELLMRARPDEAEGSLTKARARMVSTSALARKAREAGLPEAIVLGRGEEKSGGREKPSILAGALEAVLGAVFLDGGFKAAREVVRRLFGREIQCAEADDEDAKTALQEYTQREFRALPVYETAHVEGPDHAPAYAVEVSVGGRVLGRGTGRSKRLAAQEAARAALAAIRVAGRGGPEVSH